MQGRFPNKYKKRYPPKRQGAGGEGKEAAERKPRQNLTPGRVTALEPQVKRPNRFSLYIDDHFALGLNGSVAVKVRVGQDLTRADLEQLVYAEQLEQARDAALHFLEVRPRSAAEIRRKLASKQYPEEIIAQVLARLTDVQLVGDREFAKYWVENREGFKPRSKRALQYELRQKGVGSEEIARAVRQVDEGSSAYRAAKPKALRYQNLDQQTFREKLTGFLARRGFDYTVTRDTVNRLWRELHGSSGGGDPDEESSGEQEINLEE